MAYSLYFIPAARKELSEVPRADARRIAKKIDQLAENPFPAGCKKLHGEDDYYRIRVGDYRVIYRVQKREIIVVIVKIGHRKEIYR